MHLDEPLSDKEFNELDTFLLSDRCGDDCMTMDALHGYLTALAIGPQEVPFAEWLPRVWGATPEDAPDFKNDKEAQRITTPIARFMNEVAMTFEVAPWGFWEGMQLRADAWQPIHESPLAPRLRPIYLLGAEEIEEEELALVDDPGKCHKLTIEIEAAIPHIHKFWAPLRKSVVTTVRHETAAPGRNDVCPCGSGKKYKKCCGAASGPDKADMASKD